MSSRDQRTLARARRLLNWGTAALGVLLLPLATVSEESWGLWTLFALRGEIPPPADVVVIGLDEHSESALGGEVERSMHATLVDTLVRAGASVIVFDIFLHAESADDEEFAIAIANAGNVVLTAQLERENAAGMDVQILRAPVAALAASAAGTAPWLVPESFRVDWVFLRDNSGRLTVPSAALQLSAFDEFMSLLRRTRPEMAGRFPATRAQLTPNDALEEIMERLHRAFGDDSTLAAEMLAAAEREQLGVRALIAMYEGDGPYSTNRLYVNYYGAPRTVVTVPYQEVLAGGVHDDDPRFAGKAVFIGYSARAQPRQRDDYPYVFSTGGFNLSGVELGATAFANLLHGTNLKLPSLPARIALVVLWGLLIATCFNRFHFRPSIALGVLLGIGYLWCALFAFRAASIWSPLVVPGIQLLFAGALSLRVKQLAERAQLSTGTSEEAALALTGRGKLAKIDHRVVLFADEQGSKKRLKRTMEGLDISRRQSLQRDFAIARDVPVTANGGRINHTLADSMLACWLTSGPNDATDRSRQMRAACRAALAIHARVAALDREYRGYGPSLRIGLDWGEISSRLNPSPEIKDWKMEGAPIHAAERLESLNKAFGTCTLVSHAVASNLDDKEFHSQALGTFVFCDDSGDIVVDPLRVYELRAAVEVTREDREQGAQFDAALTALRQCDWQTALTRFEAVAATGRKHSELAARYASWCKQTLGEAGPRWRGVVMVTFSDKSQYLDRFL